MIVTFAARWTTAVRPATARATAAGSVTEPRTSSTPGDAGGAALERPDVVAARVQRRGDRPAEHPARPGHQDALGTVRPAVPPAITAPDAAAASTRSAHRAIRVRSILELCRTSVGSSRHDEHGRDR